MSWTNQTRYEDYYGGTDDAHNRREAYGYTTMPVRRMGECMGPPTDPNGSWFAVLALIASVLLLIGRK